MRTDKMQWFCFGIPALVLVGVGIGVAVHTALGRSWTELAPPVATYVALQVAVYICMFWARNRARTQQDYRPAIVLFGAYCWGSGLLVIYYGIRWGLIVSQDTDDLVAFSVIMIVVVAITFGVFSMLKGRIGSHG
jgi:ABC-type Mn2+/Zn2+ transport system permease subunit